MEPQLFKTQLIFDDGSLCEKWPTKRSIPMELNLCGSFYIPARARNTFWNLVFTSSTGFNHYFGKISIQIMRGITRKVARIGGNGMITMIVIGWDCENGRIILFPYPKRETVGLFMIETLESSKLHSKLEIYTDLGWGQPFSIVVGILRMRRRKCSPFI